MSPSDSTDPTAESDAGNDEGPAPVMALTRQAAASSVFLRCRWADPAFRAKIAAGMAARWQDPAYRERARGNHRDERAYRWQHVPSGRIVTMTKRDLQEEFGLKPHALDSLVAGRIQTSRGWRLAPRSLLGESPRWLFP